MTKSVSVLGGDLGNGVLIMNNVGSWRLVDTIMVLLSYRSLIDVIPLLNQS